MGENTYSSAAPQGSVLINIRVERRAIAKHERDIGQSAKRIKRHYELLKETAKGHEHLQKLLEREDGAR